MKKKLSGERGIMIEAEGNEQGRKQEKQKKSGKVKRVLRWIWVGVLSVLIFLALFFQAPWKITWLFVIFLLACTVLPKPARKWFWLCVSLVVVVLIVWVFLPEGDGDWQPYSFDDELAVLEAKHIIPDEENAALIYTQLLEAEMEVNDINMPEGCYDLAESSLLSSERDSEVAEWLAGQESTIELLLEVGKMESCHFPIDVSPMMPEQTERNSTMREWARLLICSGNNDHQEGRMKRGLDKYLATLRIGGHICQQPTMLDVFTGMAIEARALTQLNRFCITGVPTEEHIRVIKESLRKLKYDWRSDLPQFVEHDKLLMKNMLLSSAYEINAKGKVRLSRDPLAMMRDEFSEEACSLTYWREKLFRAWIILGWFVMPSTPQKAGEIIDASFERYNLMAKPDFDWNREPQSPLSIIEELSWTRIGFDFEYSVDLMVDMSEETYYRGRDLYLLARARKQGTLILAGLRRFKNETGDWPEKLDDIQLLVSADTLVDPVAGDSFVYRLTDENFTLYSKGKNNIDEYGENETSWHPSSFEKIIEADDRSIWPSKSCKSEEEQENE